jgi:DnaJ-domain-containing protein 1
MPWRDSLVQLKGELTAARASRLERLEAFDRQVAGEREELLARQDSLGISTLLKDMNDILLDGEGEAETTVEWETGEDEEPFELEEDAADVITTALSWNEGEELEIVVELVMLEEGISLMVNGVQIRQDRDALERALLSSFRDQLEV